MDMSTAIKEIESGGMASFSSIDELMEDLNELELIRTGSQRDNSFDYLNELRVKLAQAVAANKEQIIYWDKGIMLPYDIMKTLQDHPKITLIFF